MLYDRVLLWWILIITVLGVVIVTSASVSVGQQVFNNPFFFAQNDSLYLLLSFVLFLIILSFPISIWQRYNYIILALSIVMLLIVLLYKNNINGASRWIIVGMLHIQPSEIAKLSFFCYLSNYLSNNLKKIRKSSWNIFKPIIIMLVYSTLILAQPDFGAVIIIFITTTFIFFIAGVRLYQLMIIFIAGTCLSILLICNQTYRLNRVISFFKPWEHQLDSNYQLIQSLIAFGLGGLWGQGLGNSVQKLNYLPEAHTDFIFSIIGEELGYLGASITLLIIFFVSFRILYIGFNNLKNNHFFSGFFSCSIGIWFSLQTFIHVSVVLGLVPTKGLTLPMISYGGSSLLVTYIATSLVIRIDFESRISKLQAF